MSRTASLLAPAAFAPAAFALAAFALSGPARAEVPVCGYEVVRSYPHDPGNFTEGLLFRDGLLYESTGEQGRSKIVVRRLDSAKPLREVRIAPTQFGEGLVDWGDQLISLTWRDGVGYRWDRATLRPLGSFSFVGEGWGMTRHGNTIYQSNGSPILILRDPATMARTGTITVTADDRPVTNLNELEWIEGEIWANVWQTDQIARIDPASGKVKAWVDLAGLRARAGALGLNDVLNGIAWDARGQRLFVTGKDWAQLFEIRLAPPCSITPAGGKTSAKRRR